MTHPVKPTIETAIEKGLFSSRWLMAPMYIGLASGLVLLLISFFQELVHLFADISRLNQSDVILGILSLIDLSLAGNLLLIVIYSGYENFVSKIDTSTHVDQPDWKGSVDFASLKLKLIASMVAISGIHLLKVFMETTKFADRDLMWMVIIHGAFILSGVFLAVMDWIAAKTKALKYKGLVCAVAHKVLVNQHRNPKCVQGQYPHAQNRLQDRTQRHPRQGLTQRGAHIPLAHHQCGYRWLGL